MGCPAGLALAMGFAVRALLTGDANPSLAHWMLPGPSHQPHVAEEVPQDALRNEHQPVANRSDPLLGDDERQMELENRLNRHFIGKPTEINTIASFDLIEKQLLIEKKIEMDPLLKPNHANVMEVPGSCEIRVIPRAPSDFRIQNGKLAMEIPRGQRFIQTQRGSTGKSFRSNPFLGSEKDKKGDVSDLARQSTLRGHGMSNFSVRISTVMSLLDSPVEIRENSIQFSMETEFCEFSPELEDHFEIFEHIRGFNVTIVTSANTQDETLPPWSGFLQKDEGETQ
ncbi:hypothetical protein NE237_014287 [Protea cynaroides]|uniref:Large ribosomal subunit protein uL5m n=1 Tax=Protea cynaroides TaxID=273540 RepID=A0A9Q0JTQ9_9MAGN|nr:hypothetical protein NE237_014287 [Protea cynaroides]